MTISHRIGNFSVALFSATLALATSSCSDDNASGSSGSGSGGSGTSSGSGGSGTSSGSGGTGSGSGGTASGGSGGTGVGSSDVLIGTFQVEAEPTSATEGKTNIIGKVYSGPNPEAVVWSIVAESGDCLLKKPTVPFCDPACGSDVCVAENVCQAYPTVKDVGEVKVTGLKPADGSTEFTLVSVNGAYQKPPAVELSFPPFDEGATVKFEAAGGDFEPFSIETEGILPLLVTSSDLALDPGTPLELTWEPATDPDSSELHVKLDISHHGGTKGVVECVTADSGSLSIDGSLIEELIDLGVAGFPTIILTRRAIGSTTISAGRVDLVTYSDAEISVEVPGVVSCTDGSQCDSGVCKTDLTCE